MSEFEEHLRDRSLTVGVVGLGYVGLPLAIAYAEAGFRCIGFDTDPGRTDSLNEGRSHVEDVATERLREQIDAGRFSATHHSADLAMADAIFVCVPTPFDKAKTPDLSYVRSATLTVASILKPGMLVVLQSTTYPGTTTEILQPALEASGHKAGLDFFLAFSPERVDPGNTTFNVHNTPKVVGGVNAESTRRARLLLEAVMVGAGLVHEVSSPAAAEMTKLLENTYRAVNIALVNELAMLADRMGLDMWEIVEAAGTKPFGFQPFWPGVGPGGHCIPVDPYYLAWKAREYDFQTRFIELAADINLGMAAYVRSRIVDQLNAASRPLPGSNILVLGASFKAGVSDTRNSRAIRVMELLEEGGANISFHDPLVTSTSVNGRQIRRVDLSDGVAPYDLVAILVANPAWPVHDLVHGTTLLFDAVNATTGASHPHIERL